MQLDLNQLRELLDIVNQTEIAELSLKTSDFELSIRKSDRPSGVVQVLPPTVVSSGIDTPAIPPEPATPPPVDKKWVEVTSPMVGTFYRSPAPDEPPFVDVGDVISRGQTVCIIEAMKLMNELESEVSGQVMEVLVQNGQPVEYGQPLLRVNPS